MRMRARLGWTRRGWRSCGDSAGGVLAAVTAIAARDAGIALRAQVLLYPSADSRESSNEAYASRRTNAQVPMLDENTKNWFTKNSLPDRSAAEHWHVSPIVAPDLTGVAPVLMVTAERDILHDEAVVYAGRLEEAGVEVMRRNVPGMVHGFVTLGAVLSAAGETVETIAFFSEAAASAGASVSEPLVCTIWSAWRGKMDAAHPFVRVII